MGVRLALGVARGSKKGRAQARYTKEEEDRLAKAHKKDAEKNRLEDIPGTVPGSITVPQCVRGPWLSRADAEVEEEESSAMTGWLQKQVADQMVEAAIAAEEECKEDRIPLRCPSATTHLHSGSIDIVMIVSVPPCSNSSHTGIRR